MQFLWSHQWNIIIFIIINTIRAANVLGWEKYPKGFVFNIKTVALKLITHLIPNFYSIQLTASWGLVKTLLKCKQQ